jgi:2-polyprenyl-3-methyl-5-hydroxy-6-metoxy-1,4-benzoquinol methylase
MKKAAAPGNIHRGKAYHEFMLASPREQRVRERFQRLVFQLMPPRGAIFDFGAGTGIDAKSYAAQGFRIFVYEPCEANLRYLTEHCREEILNGAIAITDLSLSSRVQLITANFAVLNLIADHRALFQNFAGLVATGGFVLVSLLNPFFVGDARYAWWRKNLSPLLRSGTYAVEGEFGPIYRFAPSVVMLAAEPDFHLVACIPRGLKVATSRYTFMLFKR